MSVPRPAVLRFACPTCGKHYSVTAARLEAAAGPLHATCAVCAAELEVLATPTGATARLLRAAPEAVPATPAPAAPAAAPASRPEKTAEPPDGPEAGQRLGRYEIEGFVGRGGMGTVYKAFDPATNRHVALKVLPLAAPPEDVLRFEREVQVQGNVQHPNIMPIFDSGTMGALRFYTMELLREPMDLAQLGALVRSGQATEAPRLRPVSTLRGLVERVIVPLCGAVHHANHREGVLHRDVTPSNVLVDVDGLRPYLIDFGVCTLLEHKNPRLAHLPSEGSLSSAGGARRVSGTLLYMPPEQARGEADRRGDVWGLGALLHFLVTGEPPVAPASRAVVPKAERVEGLRFLIEQAEREGDRAEAEEFRAKLEELEAGFERRAVDAQRDVLKGVYQPRPAWTDPALDAVIGKAMAPDPEDRYLNAKELAHDLEAWLEGRTPKALGETRGGTAHVVYTSRQTLRRLRVPLLLLVLLGVSAFFLVRHLEARAARERTEALESARGELAALLKSRERDLVRHERAAWKVLELDPKDADARLRLLAVAERRELDVWLGLGAKFAAEAAELDRRGDAEGSRRARAALARLLDGGPPAGLGRGSRDLWPGTGDPENEQLADWERRARDERLLTLAPLPQDVRATLRTVASDGGLGEPTVLEGSARVPPGRYVIAYDQSGRRTTAVVEVPRALDDVRVPAPPDLARIPAGLVLVPGGRVRGPLGETVVPTLLWEPVEVTVESYAAWLDRLPEAERALRVPRQAGRLGDAPRALWARRDGRFVPPGGSHRKPVDSISLHDARAFAAAQGRRLPTAQEWAWAASGPLAPPTPIGAFERLFSGAAWVGRDARSPREVGATPGDLGVHGLSDLAGNVAEWTATQATVDGVHGWLVMGSGYGLPPERAILSRAKPEPGWLPLEGVGFRLVADPAP
jgi:serine/threonine protein kinase/formylglycine-generating enzyme required for sulfatase activity